MVHNTEQLFNPNIFRIQFYLLVEILRVALLRVLQVNCPARNSMLAKFMKKQNVQRLDRKLTKTYHRPVQQSSKSETATSIAHDSG